MMYLELCLVFLKIGLFSFGGGYGMLSLIQNEVVTSKGWLTMSEFTDIVAISQMTPGPIGINSATYVGYTALISSGSTSFEAIIGSLTASISVMLPSFILMLFISRYLMKYKNNNGVNNVFEGLRPVVVGLIASAALLLINSENFGIPYVEPVRFIVSILIALFAFAALRILHWNPIRVLIVCGIAGGVFFAIYDNVMVA